MSASDRREPLISVVIPVFNGEEYVAEAIESVLGQTIGLDALEVVVIDDGSADATPRIVDDFAQQFPLHVKVFHQANQGVAAALNAGVQVATGRIIGFLGSDDRFSSESLELVADFFAEHGEVCDLAAIPIFMFGARQGPHWNNRSRFATTRVIDVREEWNLTQIHGGGTFIKSEIFQGGDLKFDPRLFISEDLTLNTQVILRKMKYGVVAGAQYFNRRYSVGGSLVSSSHFRSGYYTEIPRLAYQQTLDFGRELYGKLPLYAQAIVAYDLSWRFRGDLSPMDPELESQYRETLGDLLRQIKVKVIMAQRAPIEVRLSMLNVRERGCLRERLSRRGLTYFLESCEVYSLKYRPVARHKPARCEIEFFEVNGDNIEIQGRFRVVEIDDVDFAMEAGGRRYPVERMTDRQPTRLSLAQEVEVSVPFRASVTLRPDEQLRPVVVLTDADGQPLVVPVAVLMHRFSRFSGSSEVGYFRRVGRIVFRGRGKYSIERKTLSSLGVVRAELGFLRRAYRAGAAPTDLRARILTGLRQAITKKRTWLITDHKSEAGDNGEAMFRYLCSRPDREVEPCFVLRKDADAYASLRRLGKVVEPNSKAHLRKFLDAVVVMNSAGDSYMLNPVAPERRIYLNDLIRHESVFLQHGITIGDQSGWLNRWSKGFDLFVTSASRERESILHDDYGYQSNQVVLTGMPRFDRLENSPNKLIIFAPTWRKGLSGALDEATGRVGKSTLFAESEYSAFWQRVVCHPRLNTAMNERGYRGVFALHPSHAAEASTFQSSERIQVAAYPHDYQGFFRDGSVLVTDYSSVAFDFAYLRKPVVYAQGDREEFFGSHLYSEGYFSYEEDGFGPIVDTVDALVDHLIELLSQSCEMEAEYRARVDRFFAFSGGGNSERLRKAIVSRLEN